MHVLYKATIIIMTSRSHDEKGVVLKIPAFDC